MLLSDKEASELLLTIGKIDERTKNMEKSINGNGQPGLIQKVDALEDKVSTARGVGLSAAWLGGSALGVKIVEWLYALAHIGQTKGPQ